MDLLSSFQKRNAMATFSLQSVYVGCAREIGVSILEHSATTEDMDITVNNLQAKNLDSLGKTSLLNV